MQRTPSQNVTLTIQTVPTTHPAGTIGNHWRWELVSEAGGVAQQQTDEPTVSLSLLPGSYTATAVLETADNVDIGGRATATFDVEEPDITIQTAGTISVELV